MLILLVILAKQSVEQMELIIQRKVHFVTQLLQELFSTTTQELMDFILATLLYVQIQPTVVKENAMWLIVPS